MSCSKDANNNANPSPDNPAGKLEIQPIIRTEIINSDSIKKYIPITSRQKLLSGSGKTKTLWKISGSELGQFEIIGNNQSDADQIGWQIPEFDERGNSLAISKSKLAHDIFTSVLSLYLANSQEVANDMLSELENNGPKTVARIFGDLSIETDGTYSFIRHQSRR